MLLPPSMHSATEHLHVTTVGALGIPPTTSGSPAMALSQSSRSSCLPGSPAGATVCCLPWCSLAWTSTSVSASLLTSLSRPHGEAGFSRRQTQSLERGTCGEWHDQDQQCVTPDGTCGERQDRTPQCVMPDLCGSRFMVCVCACLFIAHPLQCSRRLVSRSTQVAVEETGHVHHTQLAWTNAYWGTDSLASAPLQCSSICLAVHVTSISAVQLLLCQTRNHLAGSCRWLAAGSHWWQYITGSCMACC